MSMRSIWLLSALLLSGFYTPVEAYPITYDIGAGTASGFSGSWLHAGSVEMGNSGFFANGAKFRLSGQLTIDLNAGSAKGVLLGSGGFGLGSSDWTLLITGATSGRYNFTGGENDLLSLNYALESAAGHAEEGMFYFAERDFNGGTASDGPNYFDDQQLFLWGNNWLNANGSSDRDAFISAGGTPLGIDLYGVAADVPEPPVALLLMGGLLGMGVLRRRK